MNARWQALEYVSADDGSVLGRLVRLPSGDYLTDDATQWVPVFAAAHHEDPWDYLARQNAGYTFVRPAADQWCRNRCPRCFATTVVDIVYGLPGPDAMDAHDRGEIVLGGCCISEGQPEETCRSCDFEW